MTEDKAINVASDQVMYSDEEYELDYDSIWKDFISEFWREILERFMPDLYDKADLTREPENLDKELRDLLPEEPKAPVRYVDALMKVFLKDGKEEWVLLHIEVQGYGGEDISRRMFRYYCLLFTHHNVNPAALAILTAKRPKAEGEPGVYEAEVFRTKIKYEYNVIKAYELDDEELKAGGIVDLFVYAVKIAMKHRNSNEKKYRYMRIIAMLLKEKGWPPFIRRRFIMYLERLMHLSNMEYKVEFRKISDEVIKEGEKGMRYRTTVEDMMYEEGMEKGLKQGIEQGIQKAVDTFRKLFPITDEQLALFTQEVEKK